MKPNEIVGPLRRCFARPAVVAEAPAPAPTKAPAGTAVDAVEAHALPAQLPPKLAWLTRPFDALPPGPPAPGAAQPFIAVSPALVRGRRPRIRELDRLKTEFGIKTIINMEDGFSTSLWPWDFTRASPPQLQKAAEERGVTMHWIPVSCIRRPKLEDIQKILDIMDDPEAQPVYLHCFKGFERTNFVLAMHRIFRENCSVVTAYFDMLNMGFRRPLVPGLHWAFMAWTQPAVATGAAVGVSPSGSELGAAACMVGAQLGKALSNARAGSLDEDAAAHTGAAVGGPESLAA